MNFFGTRFTTAANLNMVQKSKFSFYLHLLITFIIYIYIYKYILLPTCKFLKLVLGTTI